MLRLIREIEAATCKSWLRILTEDSRTEKKLFIQEGLKRGFKKDLICKILKINDDEFERLQKEVL